MKPWYEELFENYAESYDREVFTRGTVAECDFIEAELRHDRARPILDIGCGTGRHAIELARRGWTVTGIDLSADQLRRARAKARAAGVTVRFERRDARRFRFARPFGAAILICEGAFPLMATDAENFEILRCAARALAPGAPFILTTLNALFPLYHSVKEFLDQHPSGVTTQAGTFDLLTFRDRATVAVTDDSGRTRTLATDERFYAPSEIAWLLASAGFTGIEIRGCDTGVFDRNRPLTPDDFEMLVIARRAASGAI